MSFGWLKHVVVLEQVLQSERLEELQAEVCVLYAVDDEEIFIVFIPDAPAKAHLLDPLLLSICSKKVIIHYTKIVFSIEFFIKFIT